MTYQIIPSIIYRTDLEMVNKGNFIAYIGLQDINSLNILWYTGNIHRGRVTAYGTQGRADSDLYILGRIPK
jgi:hypothetical protein